MPKECHHSFFYPILKYCIDMMNNSKDLDKLKLNIDLYEKDNKVYATVGRQIHALFFTGDQGLLIDTILILVAIKSRNKEESKKVIKEYKEYLEFLLNLKIMGLKK